MARRLESARPVSPDVAHTCDADHKALPQGPRTPAIAFPAVRPIKAQGPMRLVSRRALVRRFGSRMLQHYAPNMKE
jgi:hypothetical protein